MLHSNLATFTLTSTAFKDSQTIPKEYTCKGKDISPPLSWKGAPKSTESFVLIVNDPDARSGNWVHWILYNIPSSIDTLPTDYDAAANGVLVGVNSWNKLTYGGPCPPSGTHRYIFTLYALDKPLYNNAELNEGALQQAITPHVIAVTKLVGLVSSD